MLPREMQWFERKLENTATLPKGDSSAPDEHIFVCGQQAKSSIKELPL